VSSTGPGAGHRPARPRQVTLAGVMATVACALLVVGLFDAMARLGSAETQQSVRAFLATGAGSRLGLGVDGVTGLLRGVVLFSGALAAAGVILAVYCMRRHRGARVGLSVVAVLMLFTTTFVAGLLPLVVALAASMMWRREARDWFNGRSAQPRGWPAAPTGDRPRERIGERPGERPGEPPGAPPVPTAAWPSGSFGAPPAGPGPAGGWPAYAVGPPMSTRAPVRRPSSVTAAVCIAWVFCALTVLLLALLVLFLLADQAQLLSELQKNPRIRAAGYTNAQLVSSLWVVSAVGIFWSLAAIALGVLAVRGVRAGQVGLVVSSAVAGVLGLATVVVPVVAFTTMALLLVGSSNRWYAAQAARGRDGSPPGPPEQPGPPDPPDASGRPPVW
jgi:hypothetical protein